MIHRHEWNFTPNLEEGLGSDDWSFERNGEPDEFTRWLDDQLEQLEARHASRTLRVVVVLVLVPQE